MDNGAISYPLGGMQSFPGVGLTSVVVGCTEVAVVVVVVVGVGVGVIIRWQAPA